MDLRTSARRRLARWAASRPHVLLVSAPGGTGARLSVEAQLRVLDGVLTEGPADADVLVIAGSAGDELAKAAQVLWNQMPAPKVRVEVPAAVDAAAGLAAAIRQLAGAPDAGVNAAGPRERTSMYTRAPKPHEPHSHQGHEQGRDGTGQDNGDQRGHPGHGQGSQGGHDHGGMQMPGGLMMADRAPDRDGLKLDALHVPLGPVLPAWPPGLVIDVQLQGDLVQSAAARVLPGVGAPTVFWAAGGDEVAGGRHRAAAHLDSIGRLLQLSGWAGAADRARKQRDVLLASTQKSDQVSVRLHHLRRSVERSWGLRRSLGGLGRLGADDITRLGISGPAARAVGRGGDAWARLRTWLAEAELALDGHLVAPTEGPRGIRGQGSDALLAAAVHLLPGLGLGDARLVMASLDPDTDEVHVTGKSGVHSPHGGHAAGRHHNGPHAAATRHQHPGHVA